MTNPNHTVIDAVKRDRNNIVVRCSCGWASKPCDTNDEASEAFAKHIRQVENEQNKARRRD